MKKRYIFITLTAIIGLAGNTLWSASSNQSTATPATKTTEIPSEMPIHETPGTITASTSALSTSQINSAETSSKPASEDRITQADMTRISEAFGHFLGRNLKAPGVNFDLESTIKGIRDGFTGKPAPMTDKEYEALMIKVHEHSFKELASGNLKAANDFLSQNPKNNNKIIEIEPGKLQYLIIEEGTGEIVKEGNTPKIKYVGKFLDGTTFGNSEETGGPITIPLDQTIPGFKKGILGMKEGEKRKLFVHPDLGYGTTGQLPPNSMLIFEIELIKADAPKELSNHSGDDAMMLDEQEDDDDDSWDDEEENNEKVKNKQIAS